jgi:ribosome biogenesis GTPase
MDISSAGLGQRPDLDAELAALGDPDLVAARVLAQHRGVWLVAEPAGEPRLVPARGRLRDTDDGPPVTGDWVALDPEGAIAAVLERRGVVVRRAAGSATGGQVLAANVDTALVVEASPEPNVARAERLVTLASAGGVPVVLVLTKSDLDDDSMQVAQQIGRHLGVADTIAVSAREGEGVGVLQSLLAPGTTAVLLGLSGAGKSTLANALLGTDQQATAPVRASDGRGRHTTVTRELLLLPHGALLIDTPGIREAGMWDGTGDAFADIDALAAECQFNDCSHTVEPGCAVIEKADPARLEAWRKLAREQKWVDDRRAAAREREQRGRAYRDVQREARRIKGDE